MNINRIQMIRLCAVLLFLAIVVAIPLATTLARRDAPRLLGSSPDCANSDDATGNSPNFGHSRAQKTPPAIMENVSAGPLREGLSRAQFTYDAEQIKLKLNLIRDEIKRQVLGENRAIMPENFRENLSAAWKSYWPNGFNKGMPASRGNPQVQPGLLPGDVLDFLDSSTDYIMASMGGRSQAGLDEGEVRCLMALSILIPLSGARGCIANLQDRLASEQPGIGDCLVFHLVNSDVAVLASNGILHLDDIIEFRDSVNPVYQLLALRASSRARPNSTAKISWESEASIPIVMSARKAFLRPLLDAKYPYVRSEAFRLVSRPDAGVGVATPQTDRSDDHVP